MEDNHRSTRKKKLRSRSEMVGGVVAREHKRASFKGTWQLMTGRREVEHGHRDTSGRGAPLAISVAQLLLLLLLLPQGWWGGCKNRSREKRRCLHYVGVAGWLCVKTRIACPSQPQKEEKIAPVSPPPSTLRVSTVRVDANLPRFRKSERVGEDSNRWSD